MMHCISKEASMGAEHFFVFNNNKIAGEHLAPVKCILAPPHLPHLPKNAVVIVLIHFFIPLWEFCAWFLLRSAVLNVLSKFVI